jgi:hypothetical protein
MREHVLLVRAFLLALNQEFLRQTDLLRALPGFHESFLALAYIMTICNIILPPYNVSLHFLICGTRSWQMLLITCDIMISFENEKLFP